MATAGDEALVARARSGDRKAFGRLVRRHTPARFALARAYLASDADAEDAVQEAFVKAFESLGQLRSAGRFAGWLARITANTCRDILRSTRDKVSLADFATSVQVLPRVRGQLLTPATLASRGERCDAVKAAVGRLPEHQRVAIMLYYTNDMTYRQMAEYLEVPMTTVKSRLHRAKKALERHLEALEAGKG